MLLHEADRPFETLHGRFRLWRHLERYDAAYRADAEAQHLEPSEIGAPATLPEYTERVLQLWRKGSRRSRSEEVAGPRSGAIGVRDGEDWWTWDPRLGIRTNTQDGSLTSATGRELAVLFEPTQLLSALHISPAAFTTRAGRRAIAVSARSRSTPSRNRDRNAQLRNELGSGADSYDLELDAERGVILASRAIREELPFQTIEALEIAFDEPLEDSLFRFVDPSTA